MIYSSTIVDVKRVMNGTTTGETVYVDDKGQIWKETTSTKDTCGTGDEIGILRGDKIYV